MNIRCWFRPTVPSGPSKRAERRWDSLPEFEYEEEAVPIAEGDLLLIYSDGISEAMNSHGVQFGHKKLTEIVQEHKTLPLQDLLDLIVRPSPCSRRRGPAVRRHHARCGPAFVCPLS